MRWGTTGRTAAAAGAALVGAAVLWGVRLRRLVRSVSSAAEHWSQPQGAPGGLLYVALGDSAAQGIGASSTDSGYVSVLAQRLGDTSGRPVQVVNLSRSGARVRDVLADQLPRLAALERVPDVVTVAVGGNDVRGYDRDRFAADVDRLADALPPGTWVADVPYFGGGRKERDAQEAADVVRASAARRGLRPVALHDAQRRQGWRAAFSQFAADWFHPNDPGHRVWADAFWAQIAAHPPVLQGRPPDADAPVAFGR